MPTFVSGPVQVSVPATSANLGPGFDSLGIALGLRDRLTAEVVAGPGPTITVEGMGADDVARDESHLVYRAMREAFAQMGCEAPAVRLHCENRIPHSRGLGSSSAAIVGGVCLARGLVAGGSLLLDDDAVLDLAARMEGHPDNVAPALLGGFTIALTDDDVCSATVVAVDPRVRVVVFVPPGPLDTRVARDLLPGAVPHADAAADAGRAALLVVALSGRPELLLPATRDFLHQDYREPAMPDSIRLVRALRDDGVPAVVSGAGPTVLAFVDASTASAVRLRVPAGWEALDLAIESEGARVTGGGTTGDSPAL